jgi:hypothetical protein
MLAEEEAQTGISRPGRQRWLSRLLLGCLVLAAVAVLAVHSGHGTGHHADSGDYPHRAGPTAAAAVPPTVLALGHRLLGVSADWELFARGPADLVVVQLDRGTITETAVPQLVTGNPMVSFLIGPHEAIVRSSDVGPAYLIRDGSSARLLTGPLAGGGPMIPGPDPGHAWVMTGSVFHPSLSLVDMNGRPTGVRIRLPQGGDQLPTTAIPDGRGYVLLQGNANNLYDAGPTWDRPVNAVIIATGPTRWLAVRCDGYYRHCHNEAIDAATGAGRVLPGPPLKELNGLYNQDFPPLGVVSPDGSTAAVPVADNYGNITVHLIDLTTGASHVVAVRLAAIPSNESMTWSPDGNWLFVAASGGRLVAVNARTRRVQGLGVTLPYVTQVAVRDAPG